MSEKERTIVICFVCTNYEFHLAEPIMLMETDASNSRLQNVLSRSVLIRHFYILYETAEQYSILYEKLANGCDHGKYEKDSEPYLPFKGKVDLKLPQNSFHFVELHTPNEEAQYRQLKPGEETMEVVMFGRELGMGQQHLPTEFNLIDRHYIGNTTMDPTLSFIQANLAGVTPSSVVIDPFVGTGRSSRVNVKFRGPNENVRANFEQYGMADRYLDVILADASLHTLYDQSRIRFDAILADPPYGIREKTTQIGSKGKVHELNSEPEQRYPAKKQYNISNVYLDLLNFAAKFLAVNGRVAYWFPVIFKEYSEDSLPQHPCLRLLYNCQQILTTSHGRRLIVMEKTREPYDDREANGTFVTQDMYAAESLRDRILPTSRAGGRENRKERKRLIHEMRGLRLKEPSSASGDTEAVEDGGEGAEE